MYPPPLAAALSGATPAQLAHWRRQPPVLEPTYRDGSRVYYSFADVVALRSLVYLREQEGLSLQAIRKAINNAKDLGKTEHLSEYKFVKMGNTIVLAHGPEAIDVLKKPGNHVVATLVDVFDRFNSNRTGEVLPLGQPVSGVSIHRDVCSGYPVVEGTRVRYDQVSSLIKDGVAPEEITEFYPSVSASGAVGAKAFADYVSERATRGPLEQAAG
ncbi:DUF433 domain-containing protein [Nocardiopsis sp. FR6]|uniref:DUF433 domain-containing protein n=1 Tax=Nocardiopsis sp. FR6 TaxID=2605986 RepID=UPI0013590B72|nr:DUF433 domain-containing protein [Nocardiopsis sp. FR6]